MNAFCNASRLQRIEARPKGLAVIFSHCVPYGVLLPLQKKFANFSFLEKCRFKDKTLWIIAEIGVFLVWKNAGPYVGTKNIALH